MQEYVFIEVHPKGMLLIHEMICFNDDTKREHLKALLLELNGWA